MPSDRTNRHVIAAGLAAGLLAAGLLAAGPAIAEVRFGGNVFVGGHDFSHQRFDRRHRAVIHLYDRPVRHPGCVTRTDGRGGTVKTCRLRRIPH